MANSREEWNNLPVTTALSALYRDILAAETEKEEETEEQQVNVPYMV